MEKMKHLVNNMSSFSCIFASCWWPNTHFLGCLLCETETPSEVPNHVWNTYIIAIGMRTGRWIRVCLSFNVVKRSSNSLVEGTNGWRRGEGEVLREVFCRNIPARGASNTHRMYSFYINLTKYLKFSCMPCIFVCKSVLKGSTEWRLPAMPGCKMFWYTENIPNSPF